MLEVNLSNNVKVIFIKSDFLYVVDVKLRVYREFELNIFF